MFKADEEVPLPLPDMNKKIAGAFEALAQSIRNEEERMSKIGDFLYARKEYNHGISAYFIRNALYRILEDFENEGIPKSRVVQTNDSGCYKVVRDE